MFVYLSDADCDMNPWCWTLQCQWWQRYQKEELKIWRKINIKTSEGRTNVRMKEQQMLIYICFRLAIECRSRTDCMSESKRECGANPPLWCGGPYECEFFGLRLHTRMRAYCFTIATVFHILLLSPSPDQKSIWQNNIFACITVSLLDGSAFPRHSTYSHTHYVNSAS